MSSDLPSDLRSRETPRGRGSSVRWIYRAQLVAHVPPSIFDRRVALILNFTSKYTFFYSFPVTEYYTAADDRKMSITRENDNKTVRWSFEYKILERYFRCNAFSQIHGCPSLGTKSHGSISRVKAFHAREISERCQYRLNFLAVIYAAKM